MQTVFGPISVIPGENKGRYPYCHSLHIEAEKKILIDPASDRNRLEELKSRPGVDGIVLSHYHEDHMAHLDLFEDKDIWMHPADAPALQDLGLFLDSYGMNEDERGYWSDVMVRQFNYRPRSISRLLKDGEVIDLGGVAMEVIHTPGHTPGHLSFYFPQEGLLFMGDYDLTRFGPWYGDVYSDIQATIDSNRRLRRIPAKVWVTGHEDGVFLDPPHDAWDRFLEIIDQRDAQLLDLIRTPKTMEEIIEARIIYRKKREPKELFDFGERVHMAKHLERFLIQGRAIKLGNRFLAI